MSDDDAEQVKDWAEGNFRAMKNRMEKLQDELRNSKPRVNINVRRVSADNLKGQDKDQIVVEHKVERWYSIDYFKKMIQDDDDSKNGNSNGQIF